MPATPADPDRPPALADYADLAVFPDTFTARQYALMGGFAEHRLSAAEFTRTWYASRRAALAAGERPTGRLADALDTLFAAMEDVGATDEDLRAAVRTALDTTPPGDPRVRLIAACGLTPLPPLPPAAPPPPLALWQRAAAFEAVPTRTVPLDTPDPAAGTDRAWLQLARSTGLFAPDSTFLLHIGARGLGRLDWTLVRHHPGARLAALLGDHPDQPEFLALSPNGRTALAVTTEEYDIWLLHLTPPWPGPH
ncbi:hypothetical protein HUT16_26005 [Kitasatospora sp. NA04385]|uniref:hypothetical protein n=1 Tax=Kitasatospora sp. NA04385 TaxID=2742135 RepID=UPI0015926D9F|nr:hypothetical protein [Kitasatospora sp. NA04385]QKW22060.1 hypothetical protein HUT16_26005 [Kitasatospora sp. NA04385]